MRWKPLFFGAVWLAMVSSASAQNITPGNHTAIAMDLSPDLGPHSGTPQFVLSGLGYKFSLMKVSVLNDNPPFSVEDFGQQLGRGYGVLVPHSHSTTLEPAYPNAGVMLVEAYATQTARNSRLATLYAAGYSTVDVMAVESPTGNSTRVYGIGVTSFYIAGKFADNGSWVIADGCDTGDLEAAYVGCRAFTGYSRADVISNDGLLDINKLLSNAAGWNGVSLRPLGMAIQGTTYEVNHGAMNLVLAPIVSATNLPSNGEFAGDFSAFVKFDVAMNTLIPPAQIAVGTDPVQVFNQAWQGNDQISFTVRGLYHGPGEITVNSDTTGRLCCGARSLQANIGLDGNLSGPYPGQNGYAPNGDPWVGTLISLYGNPAAVLESHSFIRQDGGVMASWTSSMEDGTAGYCLYAADDFSGPWFLVQYVPAKGPGQYQCLDQVPRQRYKIMEIETGGDTLQLALDGVTEPSEVSTVSVEPTVNTDSLLAVLKAQYPTLPAMQQPQTYDRWSWIAVCPDSFADIAQVLANYRGTRGEYALVMPLNLAYGGINAYPNQLLSLMPHLKYVTFMGGTKVFRRWNDPYNWEPHRPGWVKDVTYSANPSSNILDFDDQGWINDPSAHQSISEAWWMSGWVNYQHFVDINGDSIADFPWGVFPGDNRAELILMLNKSIAADQQAQSGGTTDQVLFMINGVTNGRSRGDAALAQANILASHVPSRLRLTTLSNSDAAPLTGAQRKAMSITEINKSPSLIVSFGAMGNRSKNGWIDQTLPAPDNFAWSQTAPRITNYSFYLGINCGQLEDIRPYDMVNHNGIVYGPGIMKKAMADQTHGPAGGVGFAAGSYTVGNQLFGSFFMTRAYTTGCRSSGDADYLATHDVVNFDPYWKRLMMRKVYFGDPANRLPNQIYRVTDVASQPLPSTLQLSATSPSNSWVGIKYSIPTRGQVKMAVYDASGRRVASLDQGEQSAGSHGLAWHPNNAQAGMYFLKMRFGRETRTQKITLLR